MNYHPLLLASLFRTIAGTPMPVSFALSGATQNPQPGEPGHSYPYELPSSLLPDDTTAVMIEGIEDFSETDYRIVSEAPATCVFAFPPLISRHSYSRDWRNRYGRCELALGDKEPLQIKSLARRNEKLRSR